VQRSLNKTRYKRFKNQYGDNSLDGLAIDWHLAGTEQVSSALELLEIPDWNANQTYAYA